MKYQKYLVMLVIVAIINSCSSEEATPEPDLPYLNLSVSSNLSGSTRLWAFVTDSKGNVIATKKLVIGFNKFTGDAPDVINLTLLDASPDPVQGQYSFTTYPDIAKNSVIPLAQSNGGWYSPGNVVGSAQVNVTNYTKPDFDYSSIFISDGYGYSIINSPLTSPQVRLDLHRSSVDALLSGHKDLSHPVYAWVNGVKNEDTPTVDFSTFQPFPATLDVPPSSQVSGYVGGYKTTAGDQKYVLFSSLFYQGNSDTPKTAKLGYLEGYDSYDTEINLMVSTHDKLLRTTSYRRHGTINSSITFPDYDLTVTKSGMEDFSYTYTGSCPYQIHKWGYSNNNDFVRWSVYSTGSGVAVFTSIPQEIVALYPALDFDKFSYTGSTFYHCTNGYSYLDYFQDFKNQNYPFNNPDYYQVEFLHY